MADNQALKMMQALVAAKKEVEATENPVYTCGVFRFNLSSDRGSFDIASATKRQVVDATKSLILHKQANETLGWDTTHAGHTVDEWMTDLKTRVAVLGRNVKLQKISELETKLYPLLTPKERRAFGLSGIEAEIAEVI